MTSFSGGDGDDIPKDACFIEEGRISALHPYWGTASADIPGKRKQLLDWDQLHILVAGCFCGFFKVQLTADGDAKNVDPGPFTSGDESLEHAFRIHVHRVSRVDAAEILLIVFVCCLQAGDLCLLHEPDSVCL